MLQFAIHYSCHFVVPLAFCCIFFPKQVIKTYLLFVCSMAIDLDHFLAQPFFDSNRCSINFHPLHTYWALGLYIILLLYPKTRILGLALSWHLMTDQLDCWMMKY